MIKFKLLVILTCPLRPLPQPPPPPFFKTPLYSSWQLLLRKANLTADQDDCIGGVSSMVSIAKIVLKKLTTINQFLKTKTNQYECCLKSQQQYQSIFKHKKINHVQFCFCFTPKRWQMFLRKTDYRWWPVDELNYKLMLPQCE